MKTISEPVHFSNLKLMGKSAAHYFDSIGGDDDDVAMRLGRACHALVLGVQPGGTWHIYEGRRAGKEYEAWKADHPGDIFIPSEMALARAMAFSVMRNKHAMDLLKGDFELPVEWTDESGRKCATRGLDVLNRKKRYVVDLKTAQTAHPQWFAREAIRMSYHAQGAFYSDAARSLGVDVQDVFLVAVEKKSPHPVTVLRLTARALHQGRKLIRSWMEQLLVCESANEWPGYCQNIVDLDIADDDDELIFDTDEEPA